MVIEILASDEMKAAGYPERTIDKEIASKLPHDFSDAELRSQLCVEYGYPAKMIKALVVVRLIDKVVLRP